MAEDNKAMAQLISKAWSDPAFKQRLLSDTAAVLKENGINVPPGLVVKAVENTDNVFHIVIPPKPAPELSDADLEKVAGGGCWFDVCFPLREGIKTLCRVGVPVPN